jgi:acyl dehydratase
MIDIASIATLGERLGQELAVSEWMEVTQDRIDRFADATGDRQWIHVDTARAQAESPFGATVAHGFLTLSLVGALFQGAIAIDGIRLVINYGVNRVRFVAPLPAGSRIRGRFTPVTTQQAGGGVDVTWSVTVEREHGDKPCCVAEWIVRYITTTEGTEDTEVRA